MKQIVLGILLAICAVFSSSGSARAREAEVLGIHIMNVNELEDAHGMFQTANPERWHYVTVPFVLADLDKQSEWQNFFATARQKKIIPIVRLATEVENDAWKVPTRKDIVDQLTFLSQLEWPTDQKYIIVFNEVNHAKEWGGKINPEEYTDTLKFASNWARAEGVNFKILPAAMDLAAPNGTQTREAFTYLNQMTAYDPSVFEYIDIWNSHSYPNPGFSSSPFRTGQNSLRGFQHELAFLKEKTGKDYQVMITETGWVENRLTLPRLNFYYEYALLNIWSDDRVLAVTPFVLRGDPGPFQGFTFLDREGRPTVQYNAMLRAKDKVNKE